MFTQKIQVLRRFVTAHEGSKVKGELLGKPSQEMPSADFFPFVRRIGETVGEKEHFRHVIIRGL